MTDDQVTSTDERRARIEALRDELVGGLLLSASEVAEILDVHPRTVGDYIRDGRLRAMQFGGTWKIPEQALREFVKAAKGDTMVDPRQAQLAYAASNGDIAAAALWTSAEDNPSVSPLHYLQGLDLLGRELRARLAEATDADSIDVTRALLDEQLHLAPSKSIEADTVYIDRVLENGPGVQMASACVWIAVASRAGLTAEGHATPGWFLARVDGRVVDTYNGGRVLTDQEAIEFVHERLSRAPLERKVPRVVVEESLRERCSTRDFLVRLNKNLQRLDDPELAKRAAARQNALNQLAVA